MYKYIGLNRFATYIILMFVKGAKLCSSLILAELVPALVPGTTPLPIMFPDGCRCFNILLGPIFDLPARSPEQKYK